MPSAWESEQGEEQEWSDREAWRGDTYPDDCDAWRRDGDQGFVWEGEEIEAAEEDVTTGWPEDLAGPEYWLFKKDVDE